MLLGAAPDLPVLLHCFEGAPLLTRLGLDRGYYFGVGGLVTRAASVQLREAVAAFPPDRIVLETDAPYLAPAGLKNRRNEPSTIPAIAAELARLRGVSAEEVAAMTTANAERVFALPPQPLGVSPPPAADQTEIA